MSWHLSWRPITVSGTVFGDVCRWRCCFWFLKRAVCFEIVKSFVFEPVHSGSEKINSYLSWRAFVSGRIVSYHVTVSFFKRSASDFKKINSQLTCPFSFWNGRFRKWTKSHCIWSNPPFGAVRFRTRGAFCNWLWLGCFGHGLTASNRPFTPSTTIPRLTPFSTLMLRLYRAFVPIRQQTKPKINQFVKTILWSSRGNKSDWCPKSPA